MKGKGQEKGGGGRGTLMGSLVLGFGVVGRVWSSPLGRVIACEAPWRLNQVSRGVCDQTGANPEKHVWSSSWYSMRSCVVAPGLIQNTLGSGWGLGWHLRSWA